MYKCMGCIVGISIIYRSIQYVNMYVVIYGYLLGDFKKKRLIIIVYFVYEFFDEFFNLIMCIVIYYENYFKIYFFDQDCRQ